MRVAADPIPHAQQQQPTTPTDSFSFFEYFQSHHVIRNGIDCLGPRGRTAPNRSYSQ